jgi:PAS domain S-box-containing protein
MPGINFSSDEETVFFLDSLFNNSPEAIVLLDNKNRVVKVNREFEGLFGYKNEDIIGLHIDSLLSSEAEIEEASRFTRMAEAGEVVNAESVRRRVDGSPVEVSILGAPVEHDGRIIGIFAIYRDISEWKKTEQRLYESLQEENVLLQEVHHRVKNNMQIISSLLNLEAMKIEDSKTRELLFVVQKRIQAMSLVHEKLYGSENISEVELAAYTRDLAGQVMEVFENSKRPEIDFHLEELKAGMDFAIPYGLIFNELVMNAHKHAFAGVENPRLMIKLYRGKKEVSLVVRDNGVGLSPDYRNKIKHSLGFTLIDSLVSQLQGRMSINSSKGTEWLIHFPVEKVLPLHKRGEE